jgi:polar amino acid transport system substrate-binding protein
VGGPRESAIGGAVRDVTGALGTEDLAKTIAPSGRLRAAINFGNPVLAQRDPSSGEPRGVSVELACELGRRLGVPVDLVAFEGAGRVFEALEDDRWDVAFLAVEPIRANRISFTAPYVVLEGTYVVPSRSRLRTVADIDRAGTRVAVVRGSAYDLYLTRSLAHTQLVRFGSFAEAMDAVLDGRVDAAAGVKQPIVAFAEANSLLRVIPGRFMAIEQAMGMPKQRDAAAPFLRAFVEEMKASGFAARALAASGQADATIAPPARRAAP